MCARILVVDDDDDVRTILSIRLARVGFEVTTASDGMAGLATLRETSPCGVVLDLFMPHMNGFEFLSALRQVRGAPPVFVVTDADDARVSERVRHLGAERLISKGTALGREFARTLALRFGSANAVSAPPLESEPGSLIAHTIASASGDLSSAPAE